METSPEMTDNAINEAIEARLAALVASAPMTSTQQLLRFEVGGEVYTGCQVAGPQLAS